MYVRTVSLALFEEADISVLYAEPCTWDSLEELIDNQLSDVYDLSDPLSEDMR